MKAFFDNSTSTLCIYSGNHPIEAADSTTIDLNDVLKLVHTVSEWQVNPRQPSRRYVVVKSTSDPVYRVYLSIKRKHLKQDEKKKERRLERAIQNNVSIDVTVPGTSRLVRVAGGDKIIIAKRRAATNTSYNEIPISNSIREGFFLDAKRCEGYRHEKYCICRNASTEEERGLFEKWDSIMKGLFKDYYFKSLEEK